MGVLKLWANYRDVVKDEVELVLRACTRVNDTSSHRSHDNLRFYWCFPGRGQGGPRPSDNQCALLHVSIRTTNAVLGIHSAGYKD